jgi:hypothetical protein
LITSLAPSAPRRASSSTGGGDYAAVVADRLAITLQSAGLPCARLTDLNAYGDEDAWHAERTPDTVALPMGHAGEHAHLAVGGTW